MTLTLQNARLLQNYQNSSKLAKFLLVLITITSATSSFYKLCLSRSSLSPNPISLENLLFPTLLFISGTLIINYHIRFGVCKNSCDSKFHQSRLVELPYQPSPDSLGRPALSVKFQIGIDSNLVTSKLLLFDTSVLSVATVSCVTKKIQIR